MGWTVQTLNETVEAEVEALPEDMRARLARIAMLIEEKGLEHVGEPHIKHIDGRLWEMRMKGKGGISRALYVAAQGHASSSCEYSSRKRRRRRAMKSTWRWRARN